MAPFQSVMESVFLVCNRGRNSMNDIVIPGMMGEFFQLGHINLIWQYIIINLCVVGMAIFFVKYLFNVKIKYLVMSVLCPAALLIFMSVGCFLFFHEVVLGMKLLIHGLEAIILGGIPAIILSRFYPRMKDDLTRDAF